MAPAPGHLDYTRAHTRTLQEAVVVYTTEESKPHTGSWDVALVSPLIISHLAPMVLNFLIPKINLILGYISFLIFTEYLLHIILFHSLTVIITLTLYHS